MEKDFSNIDVVDQLVECLENGFSECYADLHNEAFNQDYYIIGRHQAEQAIMHTQIGVFGVINTIKEYEMDNFDTVLTDFSDPEKVANMYWYIQSDKYMFETKRISDWLNEHWNDDATEELNNQLIELL